MVLVLITDSGNQIKMTRPEKGSRKMLNTRGCPAVYFKLIVDIQYLERLQIQSSPCLVDLSTDDITKVFS
ncbi:MAG: hypothetical protein DRI69_10350 [Bacteroidetes bacterium]|nr:MAG: hypothetical protein DRI69_10350 [Bacteroidota bacterium]